MVKTLIGSALLLTLSAVLISNLGQVGILITVGLVVVTTVWLLRQDSERETAALRRSIDLSATDIATILDAWDDFRNSDAPQHIRDRGVHRPELCDPSCGISSVARFHTAADSCERFLRHLPQRSSSLSTVAALNGLLKETDRRAVSLERLWDRARRDSVNSRHP